MDITIFNHPPIFLNYIIYLKNIYENQFRENKKFPIDNYLQMEELNIQTAWNYCIGLYTNNLIQERNTNAKLCRIDSSWETYSYELLNIFNINEKAEMFLKQTFESFLVWWWLFPCGGKYSLEFLSDQFVSKIYHEINNIRGQSNIFPNDLALLFIYDVIPHGLNCFDSNYAIISIKDIYKKNGISIIANKLYNQYRTI